MGSDCLFCAMKNRSGSKICLAHAKRLLHMPEFSIIGYNLRAANLSSEILVT